MDDPRWLRIIIVGLVLAALAIGYYLLSGVFSLSKPPKSQTAQNIPSPSAASSSTPSATNNPQSAYQMIAQRNQQNVNTLPKTGIPILLLIIFSSSAIVAGLGLRKFPE